jgi:DNA-binding beta-propeller fold protein YncE
LASWQTENIADDVYFSNPVTLGTASASHDLVGSGTVNYYFNHVNTWQFNAGTNGANYTLSLDCFDDGTSKARMGFDLYDQNGNLLASSANNDPLDQITQNLSAGSYFVAVYAVDSQAPSGDYHLVIQSGTAPTATSTPTVSPTPLFVPHFSDITSLIDSGNFITGDTTGLPDNYNQPITYTGEGTYVENYGLGSPDVVYQFTLTSPKSLFIDNCNTNFESVLYLRTNPADPTTTIVFDEYLNSCSSESGSGLVTGTLKPGTYYLILDGAYSGDYGPYSFSISTFEPNCVVTPAPTATPISNVAPSSDAVHFSKPTYLGTAYSNTALVGSGTMNYYFNDTETWHFKAGTNGANYLVSLDCYDDGTGKALFNLYVYDSHFNLLGSYLGDGETTPAQDVLTLPAGDYYVAVEANSEGSPNGDYHLIIQGQGVATPTLSPTVTPTVTVTPTPEGPKGVWNIPGGVGRIAVNSAGTTVYVDSWANYENLGIYVSSYTSTNGLNYSAGVSWGYLGSNYSPESYSSSWETPQGLAVDSSGNVYAADSDIVRKYNAQGILQENIGTANSYDEAFGGYPHTPSDVAVDSSGNIYLSENDGYASIQVFNSSGSFQGTYGTLTGELWPVPSSSYFQYAYLPVVATNSANPAVIYAAEYGGTSIYEYSVNPGAPYGTPVTLGQFGSGAGTFNVGSLAVAPAGSPHAGIIYASDKSNNRILEFDPYGNFVGQWGSYGTLPGQFNQPQGLAVDGAGNVYVADSYNNRFQKFAPPAPQYVFPSPTPSFTPTNTPTNTQTLTPTITSTPTNSLTPTLTLTPIFSFTPTPTIEAPLGYFGTQGTGNGQFSNPSGLSVNSAGTTVYVSDYNNSNVQAFTGSAGNYSYSFQWGSYCYPEFQTCSNPDFQFAFLGDVAMSSSGNIYVVDANNARIMEYNSTGTSYIQQFGSSGASPGQLTAPSNVAVDGAGNVYISNDNTNGLNYSLETYNSGAGVASYWSPFANPHGVAINSAGTTVYVSNGSNAGQIGAYSPNGSVTYAVWNGSTSGKALNEPYGLAVDANGDVYVADYFNNRIVKFDYAGNYISELSPSLGSLPGEFQHPYAVAVDGSANVYVVDNGNYRVEIFPPF